MPWSEFSFILKPSPLGGIGVFATHDFGAGVEVFRNTFQPRILKKENIPADFLKYCIYLNDDELICPEQLDRMEIGWFINHSKEANIARKASLHQAGNVARREAIHQLEEKTLITIKNIKAGDEILIDYNSLDEPEYLKDDYYR